MTPSELNQFLNTPKTGTPELPKTDGFKFGTILLAGVTIAAVIYAVHIHFKIEELKSKTKRGE